MMGLVEPGGFVEDLPEPGPEQGEFAELADSLGELGHDVVEVESESLRTVSNAFRRRMVTYERSKARPDESPRTLPGRPDETPWG